MKLFGVISLFLFTSLALQAQSERKIIRQGVKAYQGGDYNEAEVQFRKAGDMNQESYEAEFNTGAALYGQQKYEETVKHYEPLVDKSSDPETVAHVWHNIGNGLLEAQQYGPSIEAYKHSLRLNPADMDTKYNLAYAKKKLQEQQQQEQNQDQQDQENQDQQDQENQDQQDQENQDQQDQENQDQQDQQDQEQQEQQEQEQQEQQDQEQQEQEQQEQDEQQQARPQEISKEDAERMLNAIQQQEKDVKDKVDKKKAAAAKIKADKDW